MSNFNLYFQNTVEQIESIIKTPIGVADKNAVIVASSNKDLIGEILEGFPLEKIAAKESFVHNGLYCKIFASEDAEPNIAFVQGNNEEAKKYLELFIIALSGIVNAQEKKNDKHNFVKSIILDNILPGDVYLKAHELGFKSDTPRSCFVITTKSLATSVTYEVVSSLFPDKERDFVISINENNIVLVKEIKESITQEDMEKLAGSICDTLSINHYTQSVIGIGRIVNNLRDLATSFKEAQTALEIGKIFENGKSVVSYEKLGVARLIYQVPTTICKLFLDEVFQKGSLDALDSETLFTIKSFFDNNLNVSETSRKLFVHRNTLVYRLEKINKLTGLDIRKFDQAILFKVAVMVDRYLSDSSVDN